MDYGYVRVSSVSQNPDRQIREMLKRGIKKTNIYVEQCSGKTCNRPKFMKLLKRVKKGDTIFFTSFDRLGRNYRETLEMWNTITKKTSGYCDFRF